MSVVQVDGSTAVTSTSTKNDAGSIRHAGTVDSTAGARNITSKDIGTLSRTVDAVGSVVASGTRGDMERAHQTRTLDFDLNKGRAQVKLVGHVDYDAAHAGTSNRNGFTIAGQSNALMRGGATGQYEKYRSAINFVAVSHPPLQAFSAFTNLIRQELSTTAIRAGKFNKHGIAGQRSNWESAPTINTSVGIYDLSTESSATTNEDMAVRWGTSSFFGKIDHKTNVINGPAPAGRGRMGLPHTDGGNITMHHGAFAKPTSTSDNANFVYKAKHGTTS